VWSGITSTDGFVGIFLKINQTDKIVGLNSVARLLQPLLQLKSNKYYKFWECVCGQKYPACNAHAP